MKYRIVRERGYQYFYAERRTLFGVWQYGPGSMRPTVKEVEECIMAPKLTIIKELDVPKEEK